MMISDIFDTDIDELKTIYNVYPIYIFKEFYDNDSFKYYSNFKNNYIFAEPKKPISSGELYWNYSDTSPLQFIDLINKSKKDQFLLLSSFWDYTFLKKNNKIIFYEFIGRPSRLLDLYYGYRDSDPNSKPPSEPKTSPKNSSGSLSPENSGEIKAAKKDPTQSKSKEPKKLTKKEMRNKLINKITKTKQDKNSSKADSEKDSSKTEFEKKVYPKYDKKQKYTFKDFYNLDLSSCEFASDFALSQSESKESHQIFDIKPSMLVDLYLSTNKSKKVSEDELPDLLFCKTVDPIRVVADIDELNRILDPYDEVPDLNESNYEDLFKFVFDVPLNMYVFLFKNPHPDRSMWSKIRAESRVIDASLYEDKIPVYALTSLILYINGHFETIVIHDAPILISTKGNIILRSESDLNLDEAMIVSMTYSHVMKDKDETFAGIMPISCTERKEQKIEFQRDYFNGILYHFQEQAKVEDFALIRMLIRYPPFEFFKNTFLKDPSSDNNIKLITDFIHYDTTHNEYKGEFSNLIFRHSLVPLWVIYTTGFLNNMLDFDQLRLALFYTPDYDFMKYISYYMFKIAELKCRNKNDEHFVLLQTAFDVVMGQDNKESSGANYTNLFPNEKQKCKREKIAYDFENALRKSYDELSKFFGGEKSSKIQNIESAEIESIESSLSCLIHKKIKKDKLPVPIIKDVLKNHRNSINFPHPYIS